MDDGGPIIDRHNQRCRINPVKFRFGWIYFATLILYKHKGNELSKN